MLPGQCRQWYQSQIAAGDPIAGDQSLLGIQKIQLVQYFDEPVLEPFLQAKLDQDLLDIPLLGAAIRMRDVAHMDD